MASRPVSWVNTAYPFAAGYLLLTHSVDWRLIVGTIFFLIPYNLLMYGINDVFDYESDLKNPRKGGIEGAVLAKKFHRTTLIASIGSCVPFVLALMAGGNLVANLTLLGVLFFVVAYSAPHLRFKERPVLDSITSSLHFVGPLIYAGVLAGFTPALTPYVVAFFLWGMASHAFGAVQDIMPDREGGIASIATICGAKITVWFAVICYVLASVLVALQGGLAWIVAGAGLLYVANAGLFINLTDKTSERAHTGWRRFLWLNMIAGAAVTITLIMSL